MKHLPIEFADWQTPCTPQADKASAAVGPLVGAGLGGAFAVQYLVSYSASMDDFVEVVCDSIPDLAAALFAGLRVADVVEVEVVR